MTVYNIKELSDRLELLNQKHNKLHEEIQDLHIAMSKIKQESEELTEVELLSSSTPPLQKENRLTEKLPPPIPPQKQIKKNSSNLEKFIGENLISKIGILFTIIGIAIGAKYSIEHELISPLIRIMLGYLCGLTLLGLGLKLRLKYENYSAVLVSGAVAVMYFMTFFAYDFYALIPQLIAFAIMIALTILAVLLATQYNRQIIAIIGLVGAYAVPFLVGKNSGQIISFFSYITIINCGILVVAFKRNWKQLHYTAFSLTWLIFSCWYIFNYSLIHFNLACFFLALFFFIFYAVLLAYKLYRKELFEKNNIILLLSNSLIFYTLGLIILSTYQADLSGAFTLSNAILHALVAFIAYKLKIRDSNFLYLIIGLALTFITISIPIQLNGNWINLLWLSEACILFTIGRIKKSTLFEKLSYPILLLGLVNLFFNWSTSYGEANMTPIFNVHFLNSFIALAFIAFLNMINQHYESTLKLSKNINQLLTLTLPALLIFISYFAPRNEIVHYFSQLRLNTYAEAQLNSESIWNLQYDNLRLYETISLINYSLLFVGILLILNMKKFRNKLLAAVILTLSSLSILVFLLEGTTSLSELLENNLNQNITASTWPIFVRYFSFAMVGGILGLMYLQFKQSFQNEHRILIAYHGLVHLSTLSILSTELILLLNSSSYKLGLSILFGVYAILLIALGIWKQHKHLRIGAIALFAITLIKLLFYDISHLNTGAKIIVFVSLGIFLLIISFLYNKYKLLIFKNNNQDNP